MSKLIIYTDGGSRGNPGPAGIGIVFKNEAGETINEFYRYLGVATNNQAEYTAILEAMEKAQKTEAQELNFYMDSELAVKQLTGKYQVKNPGLIPLYLKILNLKKHFKKVNFTHVRREYNKEADALANKAMDEKK